MSSKGAKRICVCLERRLRVKDFQLVSLKMIVSSMLLHQSKLGREMHALAEEREQLFAGRLPTPARRNRSGLNALPRRLPSGDVGDDENDAATAATCELSSSGGASSNGASFSDLTHQQHHHEAMLRYV